MSAPALTLVPSPFDSVALDQSIPDLPTAPVDNAERVTAWRRTTRAQRDLNDLATALAVAAV